MNKQLYGAIWHYPSAMRPQTPRHRVVAGAQTNARATRVPWSVALGHGRLAILFLLLGAVLALGAPAAVRGEGLPESGDPSADRYQDDLPGVGCHWQAYPVQAPDGPSPDEELMKLLTESGHTANDPKGLGDPSKDRPVAHSFTGLGIPGMRIVDARLKISAQPGDGGSGNDALHLVTARGSWNASPHQFRFFSQIFGLPWTKSSVPNPLSTAISVSSLPQGQSLLAGMNSLERLDVYIQDDTTIQEMELEVLYCPCEDWTERAAGDVALPHADLVAQIKAAGFGNIPVKDFGDTTTDRPFGHSFENLSVAGAQITAAEVVMEAQPGGSGDPTNDTLYLMVADGGNLANSPREGWFFASDLNLNWQQGGSVATITQSVTDPALLQAMNDDGRLDVYVQDDTTVLSLSLRLQYRCCEDAWSTRLRGSNAKPHQALVDHLTQIGFVLEGFGDSTPDQALAHSFNAITIPGTRIAEAQLIVVGKRGSRPDAANDTVSALVAPPIGTGGTAQNWTIASHWNNTLGDRTTVLPITTVSNYDLLKAMNDYNRLDVYVQDDFEVDRIYLRLRYVCCGSVLTRMEDEVASPSEELDTFLQLEGFQTKSFGDPTTGRAFAHSFEGLSIPGMKIASVELMLSAQPARDGDPTNDGITVLVADDVNPSSSPRQDWSYESVVGQWNPGDPGISLAPLAITDPDLLDMLNDETEGGRLDVYSQDATTVMMVGLRIRYVCCDLCETRELRDGPGHPSRGLRTVLDGFGIDPDGLRQIGEGGSNQAFAHSFEDLLHPECVIAGGKLIIEVEPVDDASNDAIHIGVANTSGGWDTIASAYFGSGNPMPPNNTIFNDIWNDSNHGLERIEIPLDAPYGDSGLDLRAAIAAAGRLDIFIQDDTIVHGLELELCYQCGGDGDTHPSEPRTDVWIDDTPDMPPYQVWDNGNTDYLSFDDLGFEANPSSLDLWKSRSIWVRQESYNSGNATKPCLDGSGRFTAHQNPKAAGYQNTICVVLREGPLGSGMGAGELELYYAKASTGLRWNDSTGYGGADKGDWHRIESKSIASDSADYRVYALPWTPPAAGSQPHYCLLARFQGQAPDVVWWAATYNTAGDVNVGEYVRHNNNVAWRNVNVVDGLVVGDGDVTDTTVIIRNTMVISPSAHISRGLTVALRPDAVAGGESFFATGSGRVTLPEALFQAWQGPGGTGGTGRGFRVLPGTTSLEVVDPDGAVIEGLPLQSGEEAELALRFEFQPSPLDAVDAAGEAYQVELVQFGAEGELGPVDGGVSYAIRPGVEPTPTPTPTISPTPTDTPTIMPPPVDSGNLANISTRARVGTGDDILIGGFIIEGGPMRVALRAIGPSLAAHGVPGFLPDPRLRLHDGQDFIAENDNWGDAANAAEIRSAGFAPAHRLESVILLELQPGAYTALVDGVGGSTGVALVEAFDAGGTGKLHNISTRARVGLDADRMIGGFIVAERRTKVAVRAIGPSLAARGVAGALKNPMLTCYDVSGKPIAANSDWRDGSDVREIGERGLVPGDDAEAVLLLELAPGAYTCHVQGEKGTTGVGLVEVFKLR